ncbi:unnamed protein product [Symbiodinium natans]|uniref:Uncharacterized protein n=1 Tax=Symbiodinium natans TaxID=878477 RepID=A0A812NJX7_9DINO|nr:unnamed protein product [Symbiodinium natans]
MLPLLFTVLGLLVSACVLMLVVSVQRTADVSSWTPSHVHGGVSLLDSSMITRLSEFPNSMKTLERKLLDLEQAIHDLSEEMRDGNDGAGSWLLRVRSGSAGHRPLPWPLHRPRRWRHRQRGLQAKRPKLRPQLDQVLEL